MSCYLKELLGTLKSVEEINSTHDRAEIRHFSSSVEKLWLPNKENCVLGPS